MKRIIACAVAISLLFAIALGETTETPVAEELVETPTVEETVEEIVEETPVTEEVVEETPVTEEIVEETPVVEEIVEETPVTEEVVEETPVIEEIIEETPVTEEVVETPVVETPVVETPVVETPVVETPVVETPVIETPVVETPIVEELPVEEALPSDIGDPGSPAYLQWDGYREYGTVQGLLGRDAVIVLQTSDVNEVASDTTDLGAMFGVDADAFPSEEGKDDYHVNVSKLNPSGNSKEGVVFVWASRENPPSPAQTLAEQVELVADEKIADEYELQVTPSDYVSGEPCRPTFALTSYPELGEGMRFAVIVDDGEPVDCGDTYAPGASGSYRFAAIDSQGATVAQSARFDVLLAAEEENLGLMLTLSLVSEPAAAAVPVAPTLAVTEGADNVYGQWTNVAASFALAMTVDPVDTETYSYAVTYNGGASWAALDASGAFAAGEGDYTVQFALVRGSDGTVVSGTESAAYALKLDFTAPLMTAVGQDLTLSVTAADSGSMVIAGVSVDGGATWNKPTLLGGEEGIYQCNFTASAPCVFAAGAIQAVDAAGNVAVTTTEVKLTAPVNPVPNPGGGGTPASGGTFSGGGSSGGGTVTRTVSHSSSDVETVTVYNGVELTVEDGAMHSLVIGAQALDLTLNTADGAGEPRFVASFKRWNGQASAGADTLVLTAQDATAGENGYEWEFSGAVYKKLAASGVEYMVFQVGDRMTALSTAGFSAGIRYNLYRAAGLASKDFLYTLSMDERGGMSLRVTVDGETYALSADSDDEFYYYDVHTGSSDLMESAFGAGEKE